MNIKYDFRRGCFSPCVFALLLASALVCSCKGASITSGKDSDRKSDVAFTFHVMGLPSGSSAPSASMTGVSKSVSRLILSSVKTLTVSLTPVTAGLPMPAAQTVDIGSSTAVSVTFSAVEYGSYTIKAVASDSSGTAQFQQSATVEVSSAEQAVSLNLLPTIVDTSITGTSGTISLSSLIPGQMKIYAIPATMSRGGNLSTGFYRFNVSYVMSQCTVIALNADGALQMSGMLNMYTISQTIAGTSTWVDSYNVYVGPCSSTAASYLIFVNIGSGNIVTVNLSHSSS